LGIGLAGSIRVSSAPRAAPVGEAADVAAPSRIGWSGSSSGDSATVPLMIGVSVTAELMGHLLLGA
jgi:hypothetical protein